LYSINIKRNSESHVDWAQEVHRKRRQG
jgi:hypothetical protein